MENNNKSGDELIKEMFNEMHFKNAMLLLFITEQNLVADYMKFSQDKEKNLAFWSKENDKKD